MSVCARQSNLNDRMRGIVYLAFSLFLVLPMLCSCAPRTDGDPVIIMKKMLAQKLKLDYEGTKTIRSSAGGTLHTVQVQISRKAPDSFRLEFLAPEDMKGQGFIKVGPHFWRISPDKIKGGRHFHRRGMHKDFEIKNLDLLLNNYALSYEKGGKVANRPCFVIAIEPKRGSPLSCKIWIDKARFLALKVEEYYNDRAHKVLKSSSCFDAITFHPQFTEQTFTVPIVKGTKSIMSGISREEVTFDKAAQRLHIPLFSPAYIPDGYQRTELKLIRHGGKTFLHAIYSDGLSTISLFQGKPWKGMAASKEPCQKVHQDGKVVYRIRKGPLTVLTAPFDGNEITLIGEIDQEELSKMFSSLKKAAE